MSSYVDEVLIKDEAVLYRGHLSVWSFIWWILFGLLLLPVFGLGSPTRPLHALLGGRP